MKGRMNKKDLDCMVKDADSDNDGFINCQGRIITFEEYFFMSISELLFQSFASFFALLQLRRNARRKEN